MNNMSEDLNLQQILWELYK